MQTVRATSNRASFPLFVRASQQCQPISPARCVVIIGPKPLPIGVLQYLDQLNGLGSGFAVADPRRPISGRAVKVGQLGAIAGEVGPTNFSQPAGGDDRAHPGTWTLAFLRGGRPAN